MKLVFATHNKKNPNLAIDSIKFFNTKNIKKNNNKVDVDLDDDFY